MTHIKKNREKIDNRLKKFHWSAYKKNQMESLTLKIKHVKLKNKMSLSGLTSSFIYFVYFSLYYLDHDVLKSLSANSNTSIISGSLSIT